MLLLKENSLRRLEVLVLAFTELHYTLFIGNNSGKEYPKSRMVARTRRAATARRSQTARHDHDHATHRTPACPPHRTHPPAHARAHASTPKHSKHHLHAHAANAALAHYMTHISMHTAPRRVSRAPLNCVLAAPLTACTAHARPLKAAMAHFHMPLHPQHTMQLTQTPPPLTQSNS